MRVAPHLDLLERRGRRVEGEEAAHEGLSVSGYELQCLVRLKATYDAREHAQDACFASGGGQFRRRSLGEQAAVAGTLVGDECRSHALEPEDRAVDDRLAQRYGGIVDDVARLEVVASVDHDVVLADELLSVGLIDAE